MDEMLRNWGWEIEPRGKKTLKTGNFRGPKKTVDAILITWRAPKRKIPRSLNNQSAGELKVLLDSVR